MIHPHKFQLNLSRQSLFLQESYPNVNLRDNEFILKATRICLPRDEHNEDERIIYEAFLIQQKQSHESNDTHIETMVCEAQFSSPIQPFDNIFSHEKFAYDAACQVIDNLLQYVLSSELNDEEGKEWEIKLSLNKKSSALHEAATHRGFIEVTYPKVPDNVRKNNEIRMEWKDPCQATRSLTEYAFSHRGESKGLICLEILSMLCHRRVAFNFEQDVQIRESSLRRKGHNRVLCPSKHLIPNKTRDEVNSLMEIIKRNGWLSTNLDSVDMTPSLHLNLVTGGKPLFQNLKDDEESSMTDKVSGENFEASIEKIRLLLEPYLYDELLPKARKLINSDTLKISDVFLRSYGENVQGHNNDLDIDKDEETPENTRLGISAHYDVYSTLTSVIAMDDVAAAGKSGLYTILSPNLCETSKEKIDEFKHVSVSNHASLRRFFPLEAGDAVLHTWDILHGVDIEPSKSRTSLIVWFTDYKDKDNSLPIDSLDDKEAVSTTPWLTDPEDDDDIGNFVLASAIQSSDFNDGDLGIDLSPAKDRYEKDKKSDTMHHDFIQPSSTKPLDPQELYFRSASRGNSFGLCRLGSYCDDGVLSLALCKKSLQLLYELNDISSKTFKRESNEFHQKMNHENDKEYNKSDLSKGLWFESAMRGNPVAQVSLADACMEEYMNSSMENDDEMLMATILFALAAQQGYEGASDSLKRVVSVYASTCSEEEHDKERISQSPLMKIIIAAQAGNAF